MPGIGIQSRLRRRRRLGGPLSLLSAAITTAGNVLLTFNRPPLVIGTTGDIDVSNLGVFAALSPSAIGSPVGNTVTLTFDPPIYSDYTDPLLNMLSNVFEDSEGNVAPAVVDLQIADNSTVPFTPANTRVEIDIYADYAAGRLWQDTGATVPVTADGDPVRAGTGRNGLAYTLNANATFKLGTGIAWLEFNATQYLTTTLASAISGTTMSCISVFRHDGSYGGRWASALRSGVDDSSGSSVAALCYAVDGPPRLGMYRDSGMFDTLVAFDPDDPHAAGAFFDGTLARMVVDGSEGTTEASTGTFDVTIVRVGSSVGLTDDFGLGRVTGRFFGLFISSDYVSGTDRTRWFDRAAALHS